MLKLYPRAIKSESPGLGSSIIKKPLGISSMDLSWVELPREHTR